MGTRSFVGVMVGNKCRAIYVHFDGYLEGVGRDLYSGYTRQADVERLIANGDRSSIDGESYKDRGEAWDDVKPCEFETFDEFYEACEGSWGEYYYIFKDGLWYCGNTYSGTKLHRKLVPFAEAAVIEETAYDDMEEA